MTLDQQDYQTVVNLVKQEMGRSDLGVLVRQLQGKVGEPRVVWTNAPGPPTLSSSQDMRGGSVLAIFAGSGYRTTAAGLITVDLYLDGAFLAGSAGYANETGSHRPTVPGAAVSTVAAGSRTWELRAGGTGNTFDASDRFTLVLIEF